MILHCIHHCFSHIHKIHLWHSQLQGLFISIELFISCWLGKMKIILSIWKWTVEDSFKVFSLIAIIFCLLYSYKEMDSYIDISDCFTLIPSNYFNSVSIVTSLIQNHFFFFKFKFFVLNILYIYIFCIWLISFMLIFYN